MVVGYTFSNRYQIGRDVVDWIHLAEDRDKWGGAVVNVVMNQF
jgi:hypothetical protein